MRSLRFRLLGLWALSLVSCIILGMLLVHLFKQTTEAQIGRGEAVVARSCDLIRERYGFYAAGWRVPGKGGPIALGDTQLRSDLANTVGLALARQEGVEGGIWQAEAGPLAYAYPTYQGTGIKTDLPAAEREQIQQVNQQAARDDQPIERKSSARAQTLLLFACPLSGPIPGLTAWTMTRIQSSAGLPLLQSGLGVLLALMLGMSAWLGRILLVWGRHIARLEKELAGVEAGAIPTISATGERELDRIIRALNDAGSRLQAARAQADLLSAQIARTEHLAGLGRIAAGVAHEIRNPIAALRLQGENALAGDDDRRSVAIGEMLDQVDRLDGLVGELLAMTQRRAPQLMKLDLSEFLEGCTERHGGAAAARGITLVRKALGRSACIDPEMIDRILDNLLVNALRHAPEGGIVTLCSEMKENRLILTVEDTGGGVPERLRDHLFEPFVTGRPDGTGLGLAIARELADAHGGRLLLRYAGSRETHQGPVFALEIPQDPSCL